MEQRNFKREHAIVLASLGFLAEQNPIPESVQREVSPFRTFRLRRDHIEQVRAAMEQPRPSVDELLGNVTLDDAMTLVGLVNNIDVNTRAKDGEQRRLLRFVNRVLGLLQQPHTQERGAA
jgi:hypothetical protein